MSAFALYRLPYEDHFTIVEQTDGEPVSLSSCAELNGQSGFVVAPFHLTEKEPLLLIRADRVETVEMGTKSPMGPISLISPIEPISSPKSSPQALRAAYHIDFANYHAHLLSGDFKKIVLARSATIEATPRNVFDLFRDACQRYPRMFIGLVSAPKCGTWLAATPEILLSNNGSQWQTMALAGTMKLEGDGLNGEGENVMWSTKNIQEQRYVATYITECLEQFTTDFNEYGPYTTRAGNLVHLRSDFTFSLPDEQHLGDVLRTLHPTPAVCGLPKRQTFDFILHNEHSPRRYYSGFMGPLLLQTSTQLPNPSGRGLPSTHLYVSLRCMEIFSDGYQLYAGGGLLNDSAEEQEWQETEAKMETMRNLIIH